MTAAKVHGIVVHGQCGNASYTRFSISSDIDLALGEDCLYFIFSFTADFGEVIQDLIAEEAE